MRNNSFSHANHIGKTPRHQRDSTHAASELEADEACLSDVWTSSFRHLQLMLDTGTAQDDDAGDESGTATDAGAMYANVPMEGACCACAGGAMSSPLVEASPVSSTADMDAAIDMLEPMSASDAMFEVIMPGGQSLRVAVSATAEQVSFFLSASDSMLGERFRRSRSVMENRLARRIGKRARLTVL